MPLGQANQHRCQPVEELLGGLVLVLDSAMTNSQKCGCGTPVDCTKSKKICVGLIGAGLVGAGIGGSYLWLGDKWRSEAAASPTGGSLLRIQAQEADTVVAPALGIGVPLIITGAIVLLLGDSAADEKEREKTGALDPSLRPTDGLARHADRRQFDAFARFRRAKRLWRVVAKTHE